MTDVECPYCGTGIEICHDDGYGMEEEKLYEWQCHKCDKFFVFRICFDIEHTAYKADCLNGGEHDYKKICEYPSERTLVRCTMCGNEKLLPREG
jgi:hypothetical protein